MKTRGFRAWMFFQGHAARGRRPAPASARPQVTKILKGRRLGGHCSQSRVVRHTILGATRDPAWAGCLGALVYTNDLRSRPGGVYYSSGQRHETPLAKVPNMCNSRLRGRPKTAPRQPPRPPQWSCPDAEC